MKSLFYSCWVVVLSIYLGIREWNDVNAVQAVLSPMDIFLALAVPIGFCQSTISYVKGGPRTLKGAQYSLGFLLIFTVNQLLHNDVASITSDALAITQDPPIGDNMAKLVDQSLFDRDHDKRIRAAALLYALFGVKTMYKSEDNTHTVFQPSKDEIEQYQSWKTTQGQVETVRHQLREQAQAITNRSLFHLSSFFVLFSSTLFYEVIRANRNAQSIEGRGD